MLDVCAPRFQNLKYLQRRFGDNGAGAEDGGDAIFIQLGVILGWNDPANDDGHFVPAEAVERFAQRRNQRQMARRQGAGTDHIDLFFDGFFGGLLRGLKQGT